jgi:RND family efflux transporter MFP subunit
MTSTSRGPLAAAIALLTLAACSGRSVPAAAPEVVTVRTSRVASQPVLATSVISGTVRSAMVAPLATQIAGDVVAVHVRVGDRVRAGQALVQIDDREARAASQRALSSAAQTDAAVGGAAAAADAAAAHASVAAATYERYAALRARGSASAQELDDVQARHLAAQAELVRARRMQAQAAAGRDAAGAEVRGAGTRLGYATVRAPFDGVVTARHVDPGAATAPGVPLLTIENPEAMRVEASVAEGLAVQPGDPVTIDVAGRSITARVTRLRPALDATSRAALVEIDLPRDAARGVRPGSFARVTLAAGERSAVTVPSSALVHRGQLASVFVVDADSVARLRLLTLGLPVEDRVEVLSGLEAGEVIVTPAAPSLREGMRVRSAS